MSDSSQLPPTAGYRIDPSRDHLIALARLAEWYERRTGRRLHRTVPYGWSQRGIDGIKLPILRLGGVRYTSEEAIAWWAEMLASADSSESGADLPPPSPPVETQAARAIDEP